ncbi:MAG: aquaporin, partial [Ruminococcus sp.]|nr:aquaporin [Ruminococcus sp.]
TSVNPARSIGPALFAGGDALKYLWIFIVAPLAGAAAAAFLYKWFESDVLEIKEEAPATAAKTANKPAYAGTKKKKKK